MNLNIFIISELDLSSKLKQLVEFCSFFENINLQIINPIVPQFNLLESTLKKGEVGCRMSHQRCWGNALESENDLSIILESDAIPLYPFYDFIWRNCFQTKEKSFMVNQPILILIGRSKILRGFWGFENFLSTTRPRLRIFDIESFGSPFESNVGTVAYVINKSASEILNSISGSFRADDFSLYREKGLNILASKDMFCMEDLQNCNNRLNFQVHFWSLKKPIFLIKRLMKNSFKKLKLISK